MAINNGRFSLLLLLLLTGCEMNPIDGGYKELGKFSSKTDAQNAALKRVLDRFNKLPDNKHYKVSYSFDGPPNQRNSQALWYDKTNQRLSIEVDKRSGIACSWDKIDRDVLQTAVTVKRGLTSVDSLGKSTSTMPGCL